MAQLVAGPLPRPFFFLARWPAPHSPLDSQFCARLPLCFGLQRSACARNHSRPDPLGQMPARACSLLPCCDLAPLVSRWPFLPFFFPVSFLPSSPPMARHGWQAASPPAPAWKATNQCALPFLLRRAIRPLKPELHLPFSPFLCPRSRPPAAAVILRSGAPILDTEATRGLTVFHRNRRYP